MQPIAKRSVRHFELLSECALKGRRPRLQQSHDELLPFRRNRRPLNVPTPKRRLGCLAVTVGAARGLLGLMDFASWRLGSLARTIGVRSMWCETV